MVNGKYIFRYYFFFLFDDLVTKFVMITVHLHDSGQDVIYAQHKNHLNILYMHFMIWFKIHKIIISWNYITCIYQAISGNYFNTSIVYRYRINFLRFSQKYLSKKEWILWKYLLFTQNSIKDNYTTYYI